MRGPGQRLDGYVAGPGSVVDGRAYVATANPGIAAMPGWLAPCLRTASISLWRPRPAGAAEAGRATLGQFHGDFVLGGLAAR